MPRINHKNQSTNKKQVKRAQKNDTKQEQNPERIWFILYDNKIIR